MTKLKWGMIGGGEGSQIGPAHRLGAVADGRFELVAGALDHRPAKGKAFAESLGIESSRAYGSWSDILMVRKIEMMQLILSLLRRQMPPILK